METLEHEIDELDAYKGKWRNSILTPTGINFGFGTHDTSEIARRGYEEQKDNGKNKWKFPNGRVHFKKDCTYLGPIPVGES